MTHQDAGHYALKHPTKVIDENAAALLKKKSENKTISCLAVHGVAKELDIPPAEAGAQADLLELRLKKCRLGLFGHEPDGKNLDLEQAISNELDSAVKKGSQKGTISCIACWNIAKNLKLKRPEVASACEIKGIKIKPCQLGAF